MQGFTQNKRLFQELKCILVSRLRPIIRSMQRITPHNSGHHSSTNGKLLTFLPLPLPLRSPGLADRNYIPSTANHGHASKTPPPERKAPIRSRFSQVGTKKSGNEKTDIGRFAPQGASFSFGGFCPSPSPDLDIRHYLVFRILSPRMGVGPILLPWELSPPLFLCSTLALGLTWEVCWKRCASFRSLQNFPSSHYEACEARNRFMNHNRITEMLNLKN